MDVLIDNRCNRRSFNLLLRYLQVIDFALVKANAKMVPNAMYEHVSSYIAFDALNFIQEPFACAHFIFNLIQAYSVINSALNGKNHHSVSSKLFLLSRYNPVYTNNFVFFLAIANAKFYWRNNAIFCCPANHIY